MGRFNWHITRKNETPKVTRHYRHVNRMFDFVLRNPAMFKSRELTIYNYGKKITDISWDEVIKLKSENLKERKIRNIIRGII